MNPEASLRARLVGLIAALFGLETRWRHAVLRWHEGRWVSFSESVLWTSANKTLVEQAARPFPRPTYRLESRLIIVAAETTMGREKTT